MIASTAAISESGGDTAQFIFTLGGPVGDDTHLTLQIAGTAANGVDYATLPAQVTIPAGQKSAALMVVPLSDAVTEGTETVTVTIMASDNACVSVGAPNAASVSIVEANTTLATALDGPNLVWITGGNAAWSGLSPVTHDGVDAAQSGFIFDNQESWLQTSVNGPGTLTFWWKVSSETDFDWLRFHIDGVLQQQISGEVNWQQRSFSLPQGNHTLRWRYVKDSSSPGGLDQAWLDQVSFTVASGSPVIASQPASQTGWRGANVTLSAVALGAAPLMQRWYFNDTNAIPNATNSTLVLNNITSAQAGSYRLVASNTLGAATSTVATVTVTNNRPVSQVMIFTDSLVASPFEPALANLGKTFQLYTVEAAFNSAVSAANRANTLVIVDAPQALYTFGSLAGFINGGGRALIQAYSLVNSPTLAATFQVVIESRSLVPLPLYDWSGAPLFVGLGKPVSFKEINLLEDVQKLHPMPGGRSVAGFVGSATPGEAAVVIGNGGRTIVNGFYAEGASTSADAIQLAQNEIAFLVGIAGLPAPAISNVHHTAEGQFGFSVQGTMGQVFVIEASADLQTWTSLQTNTLGSGPLTFTDPEPAWLPKRFLRVRTNP
ncbi:MAG: immunoglobulin domain-containing protein [Verrucomicrobia bacterium]|nr:immunoglobulin domain-containing protein [Verrucomicrobiota bacterium]